MEEKSKRLDNNKTSLWERQSVSHVVFAYWITFFNVFFSGEKKNKKPSVSIRIAEIKENRQTISLTGRQAKSCFGLITLGECVHLSLAWHCWDYTPLNCGSTAPVLLIQSLVKISYKSRIQTQSQAAIGPINTQSERSSTVAGESSRDGMWSVTSWCSRSSSLIQRTFQASQFLCLNEAETNKPRLCTIPVLTTPWSLLRPGPQYTPTLMAP